MKVLNEFCKSVLDKVCEEMEVNYMDVINGKDTLSVDARSIYIALLSEKLSVREINKVTGISPQVISKLKNEFSIRVQRWSVAVAYKNILNCY